MIATAGRALVALALLAVPAACTSTVGGSPVSATALTDHQISVATARQENEKLSGRNTTATAVRADGPIDDSNTGHPCPSGPVLKIELIGDEFDVVYSPSPFGGDQGPIRAVLISADAESGAPCLISVRTGDPHPDPGAVVLFHP
jgi:hypothetical protein